MKIHMMTWNGHPNTCTSTIIYDLWHEYISSNVPSPFLPEHYKQLQESIRRAIQAESKSASVSSGRRTTTKGHAVTLGKLIKLEGVQIRDCEHISVAEATNCLVCNPERVSFSQYQRMLDRGLNPKDVAKELTGRLATSILYTGIEP